MAVEAPRPRGPGRPQILDHVVEATLKSELPHPVDQRLKQILDHVVEAPLKLRPRLADSSVTREILDHVVEAPLKCFRGESASPLRLRDPRPRGRGPIEVR